MKQMLTATAILVLGLSYLNASNNENNTTLPQQVNNAPITGGFGLKLGDVFDIKSAKGSSKTTSGEILYSVRPTKTIKYFKEYYVLVTPTTHKIREIWGIGQYSSKASCEKDLEILEVMLEKKYGKSSEPTIAMEKIKFFTDNNNSDRGIVIKCSGFMNPSFYIMYKDRSLNELSKKEEAEVEAQKIDDSVL